MPTSSPPPRRNPLTAVGDRFRRMVAGRGRVVLIVVFVLLAVLAIAARRIATFYTNYLWYDSLGRSDMFWGLLRPKVFLFVVFFAVFAVLGVVNLVIADRLAPVAFSANTHPVVERFHEFFGQRLRAVRIAVALFLAVVMALPAASQWQEWLMFRNTRGFGISDPQFGIDAGFYLFKLPFLTFVIRWLFVAVVLVILLVVATHTLNGGIVIAPPRPRVRAATKAHVAALLAVLALIKAADYWVSRYEATSESRGIVRGALYTIVHADLPALVLLALIGVFVAALFLSTLRTGSWRLPLVASALWLVIALIGGFVLPATMQALLVNPNLKDREGPYIERNVSATRFALGITDVQRKELTVGAVSDSALKTDSSALSDVRLVDPNVMVSRFNADRGVRNGFRFFDLDADRYQLDGRVQQVVVGARELDLSTIGNRSWQGQHLISTHGCGVVVAPANRVDVDGRPAYQEPKLTRPELYVGEEMTGYAVVDTSVNEQTCAGQENAGEYAGTGGVRLSSTLRRLAYAISEFDYNLFGSSAINDNSRLISVRRVQDRVRKLAPFLSFDNDPYPVVVDSPAAPDRRVVWVLDGYTTSNRYPYAQSADRSQLASDSGLTQPFNYIRNSVKAVVDAYDGSVTLYVVADDPIVRTWWAAFPDLFTSGSRMPEAIREHLRYPEDLFRIQTAAYSKYQLAASDFLDRDKAWSVAPAPPVQPVRVSSVVSNTGVDATAADTSSQSRASLALAGDNAAQRFEPYYSMFHEPAGAASSGTAASGSSSTGAGSSDSGSGPTGTAVTPGSNPSEAPGTSGFTASGLVPIRQAQATTTSSFQMLRPFVPFSPGDDRPEMSAFMTVGSDPDNYGQLTAYVLRGASVDGPITADAAIESDSKISSELSLVDQHGSSVRFGTMQIVPVGAGLVWIRPVFLQTEAQLPAMRQVVVYYDQRAVMAPSLSAALAKRFPSFDKNLGDVVGSTTTSTGGAATTTNSGTTTGTGVPSSTGTSVVPSGSVPAGATVRDLLAKANALFAEAQTAYDAHDLGTYQRKIDEAEQLVAQALALTG